MNRKELEAKAAELKIKFTADTTDEVLALKIQLAESEANTKAAETAKAQAEKAKAAAEKKAADASTGGNTDELDELKELNAELNAKLSAKEAQEELGSSLPVVDIDGVIHQFQAQRFRHLHTSVVKHDGTRKTGTRSLIISEKGVMDYEAKEVAEDVELCKQLLGEGSKILVPLKNIEARKASRVERMKGISTFFNHQSTK